MPRSVNGFSLSSGRLVLYCRTTSARTAPSAALASIFRMGSISTSSIFSVNGVFLSSREDVFIELMTWDRQLKTSREGSKRRNYGIINS